MIRKSILALASGFLSCTVCSAAEVAQAHKVSPLQYQTIAPDYVSEPVQPTFKHVDVRDLAPLPRWQPGDPIREIPRQFSDPEIIGGNPVNEQIDKTDRGAQRQRDYDATQRAPTGGGFNTPIFNFPSFGNTGVSPSDVNGDVGKDHFVDSVNGSGGAQIAIYDKLTGAQVGATFNLETLGSGGACASGFGDAIIMYDEVVERWVLTEFVQGANDLCFYVSAGSDPSNTTWTRYNFVMPSFPDYPKYGVWSDAYYAGANENSGGGRGVYAFDRTAMLNGAAATFQRFTVPNLAGFGFQVTVPADHDGAVGPPPPGAPGLFMRHRDDESHNVGSNNPNLDFLEVYELNVDFAVPANSSFDGPQTIEIESFDSNLNGLTAFNAFPQPSGQRLDPLREPVMNRLVYRNFGAYEVLLGNLVTDVDGNDTGGVRWFELRRTGGSGNPWTLFQEGTYAPTDAGGPIDRWMAAIAMDESGNIALGYSVVRQDPAISAGLRYVGRLDGDSPGVMTTGENSIVAGTGSQGGQRWGDYHSMSVDPVDGCTFWFSANFVSGGSWNTQLTAMRFDACGDPTFTLSADNREQEVCAAPTATDLDPITVTVTSRNGFTDPVDLTFDPALPTGFSGAFSVPQVMPTGTSQADISVDNTATPGATQIDIKGTSGITERTLSASVFVTTMNAGTPTLTAPLDAAIDIPDEPVFSWQAVDQAQTYMIEVATDVDFHNIVATKMAVGTSTMLDAPLNTLTQYFWRVSASNACGSDGNSQVFSFTTVPAPGDCTNGNQSTTDYNYGFEAGAGGWTSSGTGNTWAQSTERVNSGTFSWSAEDPTQLSDQRLVSPAIPLPSGQSPLTLQFFQYRDIEEANAGACWDAGILEVSTDGGNNWTQVPNSALLTDPYTGQINAGNSTNPLAGLQGWCDLQDWTKTIVDIEAFAGQSTQFRFRLGSDGSVGAEGWYIDDVRVQSCLDDSFIFRDGFE